MGFIFPSDQALGNIPVYRTLLNSRVRWLTSLLLKSLNKVDGRPSGPGALPLFCFLIALTVSSTSIGESVNWWSCSRRLLQNVERNYL